MTLAARRRAIAVLAFAGFGIATYLALYQWRITGSVWDPLFGRGSEIVLDSSVSRAIRQWTVIPDSALGAIAYAVELMFAIIGPADRARSHPILVLLFGANAAALVIGAVALVSLQAFMIGAWCLLCLCSAGTSLVIGLLAASEVRAATESLARRHDL